MNSRERDRFDDLPILADLRDRLAEHMRAAGAAGAAGATGEAGTTGSMGAGSVTHRGRTGWAVAGLRRVPLALAVAVTIAVVAVGLVALHHRTAGQHPNGPAGHGGGPQSSQPPGPAPPEVPGDISRAQRQTIAHDHACAQPTNHGQTINHGSPPQSMLSVLGVLRRPPLPPDPTNKVLYGIGWDVGAGVYVNYIRRARTEYGRSYWIVPEARTVPFGPIPARCYAEFRATLERDLRHASPAARAQTLKAQQEQLSAERQQSEHREGLCFIVIGLHTRPRPGAVGFGCSGAPTDANPLVGGAGFGGSGGATINAGVVPDGFVAVIAHFPATAGAPAATVTSDVVNNVYVLKVPRGRARAAFIDRWRLRRADGSVVTVSAVAPPQVSRIKTVTGGRGGGG